MATASHDVCGAVLCGRAGPCPGNWTSAFEPRQWGSFKPLTL